MRERVERRKEREGGREREGEGGREEERNEEWEGGGAGGERTSHHPRQPHPIPDAESLPSFGAFFEGHLR